VYNTKECIFKEKSESLLRYVVVVYLKT